MRTPTGPQTERSKKSRLTAEAPSEDDSRRGSLRHSHSHSQSPGHGRGPGPGPGQSHGHSNQGEPFLTPGRPNHSVSTPSVLPHNLTPQSNLRLAGGPTNGPISISTPDPAGTELVVEDLRSQLQAAVKAAESAKRETAALEGRLEMVMLEVGSLRKAKADSDYNLGVSAAKVEQMETLQLQSIEGELQRSTN